MAEVLNLQRKVSLDVAILKEFAEHLVRENDNEEGNTFSVALVSDRRMKQLNQIFRDKDATTDVLSFPRDPDSFDPDQENLGDIVISVEQAQRQAHENGLALENELQQLILHGYLHLCGMDHENDTGEMNDRELRMRESLRI
jgi:probable rRNA maturation factor